MWRGKRHQRCRQTIRALQVDVAGEGVGRIIEAQETGCWVLLVDCVARGNGTMYTRLDTQPGAVHRTSQCPRRSLYTRIPLYPERPVRTYQYTGLN